jgi:hypothetical protein
LPQKCYPVSSNVVKSFAANGSTLGVSLCLKNAGPTPISPPNRQWNSSRAQRKMRLGELLRSRVLETGSESLMRVAWALRSIGLAWHGLPLRGTLTVSVGWRAAHGGIHRAGPGGAVPAVHAVGALGSLLLVSRAWRLSATAGTRAHRSAVAVARTGAHRPSACRRCGAAAIRAHGPACRSASSSRSVG